MAKIRMTESCTNKTICRFQTIKWNIGQGVPVRIPGIMAKWFDFHHTWLSKNILIFDFLYRASFTENGASGTGFYHVGRIPADLIVPGIVVTLWRYQSS